MEEREVMRLICQYLHEHHFLLSLEALEKESGKKFNPETMAKKTGELQAILDEHVLREKQRQDIALSVEQLFGQGRGEYANQVWCSFDDFTSGANVLVVRLIENGVLAFGASRAQVGTAEFTLPLPTDSPPVTPIPTIHNVCNGAVLAVDFHPQKRNLLLCGSMDRQSFLLDLDSPDNPLVQTFKDHSKYVVRCLWAPSGKYFVTASYDKMACVYRPRDDDSGMYELVQRLEFRGALEGLAFAKDADVFVVSVRNDYLLHCYDLSSGTAIEAKMVEEISLVTCSKHCINPRKVPTLLLDKLSHVINLNAFGDDYVSFVAMHISFSPDGRYILVSTDRDRLIMYSWETGKQITNLYGATNDEYSQPRHCWDPSGKYIYGTSQDQSICVWEIRSQTIVDRLEGHTGAVRDLHFCNELGILVSCGFDGTVKFWRNTHSSDEDTAQKQT